jgi:hypothetical protein
LSLDDSFCLPKSFAKQLVFFLQLGHFVSRPTFSSRFAAAPFYRHRAQDALFALPPPPRQARRVKAFSAQQRTQLTGLVALVGLLQDAQLVACCQPASAFVGTYLRVGSGALGDFATATDGCNSSRPTDSLRCPRR